MTDEQADHIRTRTKRLGLAEVDIESEWATEAVMDIYRLAGPASSGESLKVIGYSPSCGKILKVWLFPKYIEEGEWYGASACVANKTNQRQYEGRKKERNDKRSGHTVERRT